MEDNAEFNFFYKCNSVYMDFSHLLLKYLLIIENSLRTNVSYVVAREFSTEEDKYLDINNFNSPSMDDKRYNLKEIVEKLRRILKNPRPNSYSFYFKKTKEVQVPPWILFYDIDFYDIIAVYSFLPEYLRKEIRDFFGINMGTSPENENKMFFDSMNLLREYRNIFAHSKRNFTEKINNSVNIEFMKYISGKSTDLESEFIGGESNSLFSCILLMCAYLKDPFIKQRFFGEMYIFFYDYIDYSGKGKKIFGRLDIFEILNLPFNFYNIMDFDAIF